MQTDCFVSFKERIIMKFSMLASSQKGGRSRLIYWRPGWMAQSDRRELRVTLSGQ